MPEGYRDKNDDPAYGGWYVSAAGYFLKIAGPGEQDKEKKKAAAKKAYEVAELESTKAFEALNLAKIRAGEGRGGGAEERKYRQAKKKMEKAEAVYKQEDFHAAVAFLGWNLDEFDVLTFSQLMALIVFGLNALATIPVFIFYGSGALLYTLPFVFIVPLGVLVYLASYPEFLAKRVRIKSLGRAPEAVNYMIMSMRLSPSLNKAITFTGNHADEPLASEFKKITWDLMMRKYSKVEDALVDFATKWGQWNEDFRRSLYAIRTATLERTEEGLKRALDKANDIILMGTRTRMETYASSLSGPTMIVFALGVLLPLILGSMMPMLSMNMGQMMTFEGTGVQESITDSGGGTGVSALPIILLLDVVFPFLTVTYAYRTLGNRPGTTSPPDVKSPLSKNRRRSLAIIGVLIAGTICLLGVPFVYESIGITTFTVLPIIIGIACGISFYLLSTTKYQKKRRDEIKALESEFPDALFQLGSRIAEGEPLETAFLKVSQTLKGTHVADLFGTISYNLIMTRAPLNEVLFNRQMGVLTNLQSRTIKATMRTVVEAVSKDAATAGQTIVGISNYLRDMNQVDHDIRNSLSSVVDMMKTTSIFFAPIVMGITIGLYTMLYNQFQELPFTTEIIDPTLFILILGIYLILIVMITSYFAIGIQNGDDNIEVKYSIGFSLPVAAVTFSMVALISQNFMGG